LIGPLESPATGRTFEQRASLHNRLGARKPRCGSRRPTEAAESTGMLFMLPLPTKLDGLPRIANERCFDKDGRAV